MKKLIAILMAGSTLTASAISFTWSPTAQVKFGDSLVSDLNPATYTAYLVYLGTDGAWGSTTITKTALTLDSESGDLATGDSKESSAGLTGIRAANNSKFTGNFNYALGANTSTGHTVAAGDSFGVYLQYTDSDGKVWFNVSESVYTIDSQATDITTLPAASFAFGNGKTQVASGSSVSSGSGWVAVPEPSTAMLALAGLALLLKRRRA